MAQFKPKSDEEMVDALRSDIRFWVTHDPVLRENRWRECWWLFVGAMLVILQAGFVFSENEMGVALGLALCMAVARIVCGVTEHGQTIIHGTANPYIPYWATLVEWVCAIANSITTAVLLSYSIVYVYVLLA